LIFPFCLLLIHSSDLLSTVLLFSFVFQYLMGVAANVSATFWYTAGRQKHNGENEPFLVWLQNLASDANAPWIVSTSYGDAEYSVNRQYAMRVNNEFVKAGLRGISLLYSSGDGGVDSSELGNCTVFVPTFPAGSPYVTAVGGSTSWNPETASNSFPSGGGFANFFSRPAYQQEAVTNYLTKYGQNLPASNLYNGTSGRGYPDIAFQSQSFWVIQGGIPQPVDGTSCASPSVSGLFTLLNDIRFAAGKPSLGFLNPFIYQYAAQFNDITQGSNPGCNSNGFQASQYWDPVTGWGSPDYKRLAAIVANLP
jgi:tripeptidyl-peptidase-1